MHPGETNIPTSTKSKNFENNFRVVNICAKVKSVRKKDVDDFEKGIEW